MSRARLDEAIALLDEKSLLEELVAAANAIYEAREGFLLATERDRMFERIQTVMHYLIAHLEPFFVDEKSMTTGSLSLISQLDTLCSDLSIYLRGGCLCGSPPGSACTIHRAFSILTRTRFYMELCVHGESIKTSTLEMAQLVAAETPNWPQIIRVQNELIEERLWIARENCDHTLQDVLMMVAEALYRKVLSMRASQTAEMHLSATILTIFVCLHNTATLNELSHLSFVECPWRGAKETECAAKESELKTKIQRTYLLFEQAYGDRDQFRLLPNSMQNFDCAMKVLFDHLTKIAILSHPKLNLDEKKLKQHLQVLLRTMLFFAGKCRIARRCMIRADQTEIRQRVISFLLLFLGRINLQKFHLSFEAIRAELDPQGTLGKDRNKVRIHELIINEMDAQGVLDLLRALLDEDKPCEASRKLFKLLKAVEQKISSELAAWCQVHQSETLDEEGRLLLNLIITFELLVKSLDFKKTSQEELLARPAKSKTKLLAYLSENPLDEK